MDCPYMLPYHGVHKDAKAEYRVFSLLLNGVQSKLLRRSWQSSATLQAIETKHMAWAEAESQVTTDRVQQCTLNPSAGRYDFQHTRGYTEAW